MTSGSRHAESAHIDLDVRACSTYRRYNATPRRSMKPLTHRPKAPRTQKDVSTPTVVCDWVRSGSATYSELRPASWYVRPMAFFPKTRTASHASPTKIKSRRPGLKPPTSVTRVPPAP